MFAPIVRQEHVFIITDSMIETLLIQIVSIGFRFADFDVLVVAKQFPYFPTFSFRITNTPSTR